MCGIVHVDAWRTEAVVTGCASIADLCKCELLRFADSVLDYVRALLWGDWVCFCCRFF